MTPAEVITRASHEDMSRGLVTRTHYEGCSRELITMAGHESVGHGVLPPELGPGRSNHAGWSRGHITRAGHEGVEVFPLFLPPSSVSPSLPPSVPPTLSLSHTPSPLFLPSFLSRSYHESLAPADAITRAGLEDISRGLVTRTYLEDCSRRHVTRALDVECYHERLAPAEMEPATSLGSHTFPIPYAAPHQKSISKSPQS